VLATRPDLIAQHIEAMAGRGDGEAFRRRIDAELMNFDAAVGPSGAT
jgi:hypothetical protein